MSLHLQQFFQLCNPDGTRTVNREAFRGLCDRFNITVKDADVIFDDLDHDKDGKISFEDFSRGFSDFMGHQDTDLDDNSSKAFPSDVTINVDHEANNNQEFIAKQHVWAALSTEAERAGKTDNDENKLKWLLEELHTTDKRYLVSTLETAVEELLLNMQKLQQEKTHLEQSWKREKQEHEKHLKKMEEEMDSQVQDTEMKMRLKAQTEMERERKSLQLKMDSETENLQTYLQLVEKVNSWMEFQSPDNYDIRLDEVRKKLDDAVHENRQLRMSLLDTKTSIALMRSELSQLRTLYEEKCRELSSEREKILEVLHEQDHLSRQLNLLHDANKRLQDTNDALRNSVDNPNSSSKRQDGPISRAKSGSILGDYFDVTYSNSTIDRFIESDEDEDADDEGNELPKSVLRRSISMDTNFPHSKRTKNNDQRLARRKFNQSDSGVSTAQELEEGYSSTPDSSLVIKEDEKVNLPVEVIDSTQPKNLVSLGSDGTMKDSDLQPSHQSTPRKSVDTTNKSFTRSASEASLLDEDELPRRKISDIIKQLGIQDQPVKTCSPKFRKSPVPSLVRETECKSGTSPRPFLRKSLSSKSKSSKEAKMSIVTNGEMHRRVSRTSSSGNSSFCSIPLDEAPALDGSVILEDSEDPFEPNGPPQQTFKVILVGDAGVGKSSFALRINKGVFVRHTSSTLSVDFLMRTIRVDGRNVAVQLWDTAGQERFRSITKSYFRNADGVMLLYDCTCEYSFLNVRQWVEDVDVSCFYRMAARQSTSPDKSLSNQRIPLMIVANKIDLKDAALKSGKRCISTLEGERLAKACDTTFIETSAKDGENVLQALANLVRCMSNRSESQLSASTMQLSEEKTKKSTCCGR